MFVASNEMALLFLAAIVNYVASTSPPSIRKHTALSAAGHLVKSTHRNVKMRTIPWDLADADDGRRLR